MRPRISRCLALTTVALLTHVASPAEAATKAPIEATFQGADSSRHQLQIKLTPVGPKVNEPTSVVFLPGHDDIMVVTEKTGDLVWIDLKTGKKATLASLTVATASEQGLLGIAFHPDFANNRRFFLDYVIKTGGKSQSVIEEWQWPQGALTAQSRAQTKKRLLTVDQPFPNHKGGQLAFGPDGFLYIAFGDGGSANDPRGNGQNTKTLLGKILRIDVDSHGATTPYGIPRDNPYANGKAGKPEIFAIGLRNPWRFSFTPDGRLIAGDVGQNRYEEVTFVPRGANLGWNRMEGFACFDPKNPVPENEAAQHCDKTGLTPPIWTYGRDEGISITGGYVYLAKDIPELTGRYIVGDWGTGKIWALKLPKDNEPVPESDVMALGAWSIQPSTFGRDGAGHVYVADLGDGQIYRISKAE